MVECRIVLKANNLDTKQTWVKRLREVIQDSYFSGTFAMLKSPAKMGSRDNNSSGKNSLSTSQRLSKDIDDTINTEADPDGSSLASFGSGNTTDSEKVSDFRFYLISY